MRLSLKTTAFVQWSQHAHTLSTHCHTFNRQEQNVYSRWDCRVMCRSRLEILWTSCWRNGLTVQSLWQVPLTNSSANYPCMQSGAAKSQKRLKCVTGVTSQFALQHWEWDISSSQWGRQWAPAAAIRRLHYTKIDGVHDHSMTRHSLNGSLLLIFL